MTLCDIAITSLMVWRSCLIFYVELKFNVHIIGAEYFLLEDLGTSLYVKRSIF